MASNKNRLNDLGFKSFRRNNVGLTIVFMVLSFLFVWLIVSLFISGFMTYAIDTKIINDEKDVQILAALYEEGTLKGNDALNKTLHIDERQYLVKDASGEVILLHGDNTLSDVEAVLEKNGLADGQRVYLDTGLLSKKADYIDKDGNLRKLNTFGWVLSNAERVTLGGTSGEDITALVPPVWMRVDLKDGKAFYGKMLLKINTHDAVSLAVFFAIMILLVFAVVVLAIMNTVGNLSSHKRITRIFFSDPVTVDKNWMYFLFKGEPLLRSRKAASQSYAVVSLSIVKFTNYCVSHSVKEGDLVIQKVNLMISKRLKKNEICARHSSSEFALLMKYNNEEAFKIRLEELVKALETVDPVHKFAFHAGVDLLPPWRDKNDKIVRRKTVDIQNEYNNASTAASTLEGNDDSGIAYFDEKLVEEQTWIDIVQEKQESALKNEEFVVYYQPKFNPRTDVLEGAEALIRWASPEYGFRGPGTIIPIFEKNGFIKEIDHYMIEHVARDQKRWLDAGFGCVPISVNVSRAHFIEDDLAEQIRDSVDREGCPRNLIEIELTESAFFDDKRTIINTIQRLKGYGFTVSMDDFGSGYSSLNSLKDMPLDVLKLDAEFFRGEGEGERGEIVVSEAIKLAKSLHMKTVAEGVEVKEQVEFLAKQGCDMIQGFYYAKPMPGEEFEEKMKQPEKAVTDESAEEKEETEPTEESVKEATEAEAATEAETATVAEAVKE